jgi:hypothetical protein
MVAVLLRFMCRHQRCSLALLLDTVLSLVPV